MGPYDDYDYEEENQNNDDYSDYRSDINEMAEDAGYEPDDPAVDDIVDDLGW